MLVIYSVAAYAHETQILLYKNSVKIPVYP